MKPTACTAKAVSQNTAPSLVNPTNTRPFVCPDDTYCELGDINKSVPRLRRHLESGDHVIQRFNAIYVVMPPHKYLRYDCVYLMRCEDFVKIGISSDPRARLINIQSSVPFEVSLNAVISPIFPSEARLLESHLHKVFADFRERGEWFSKDVLPYISDQHCPKHHKTGTSLQINQ